MLFEEFFKKKKISLDALQQGDPAIFLEFKEHYEQMGEKSFDHTKKYWFNKLRRLYPLPSEVKAEKPHLENQVAEQTVADTLTEPTPRDKAPNLGFKPKFKAGTTAIAKPPNETPVENITATPATEDQPAAVQPAAEIGDARPAPSPKLGFRPKFKATPAKPTEESTLANTSTEPAQNAAEEAQMPAVDETAAAPKPAYKPRFQAKNMPSKPAAEPSVPTATDTNALVDTTEPTKQSTEASASTPSEEAAPKLGFKPRFKASAPPTVINEEPKAELLPKPQPTVQENPIQEPEPSSEPKADPPAPGATAAKPVYKPRFNPKMVKPKPPPEEGDDQ